MQLMQVAFWNRNVGALELSRQPSSLVLNFNNFYFDLCGVFLVMRTSFSNTFLHRSRLVQTEDS